jgi:hypothetical protein
MAKAILIRLLRQDWDSGPVGNRSGLEMPFRLPGWRKASAFGGAQRPVATTGAIAGSNR